MTQHPDDEAIDKFAAAMKVSMAESRAKGRSGWDDPNDCSNELLSRKLREHVDKGDPLDVVIFTMMLHQRGERIAAPEPEAHWSAFQERVHPWLLACFGAEIAANKLERGDRLAEEVAELLQSGGYPRERFHALIDYSYAKPIGDMSQEVGGVMTTLAAYCLAHDVDMHLAAEKELLRVWKNIDKIRAKQAAKPRGSALPIAVEPKGEPEMQTLASELTLDEYQRRASRTAIYPGRGSFLGLMYVTGKLNGEAGEVAEGVFKAMRDDRVVMDVERVHDSQIMAHVKVALGTVDFDRRAALKKEIGDVLWYISQVAYELGYDLSEIATANVNKLLGREQRGTLLGSGDNR